MNKPNIINKISQIFNKGENIIDYLKKLDGREQNDLEDILISYDFQAGSYIRNVIQNPEYITSYTQAIADIINRFAPISSIMEAGVGEATTLANLLPKIHFNVGQIYGFDISWSRIAYAHKYMAENKLQANLFVGDLFNIPLPDNAIDIIYTSHSIEPNGGRETEAIAELYRVTAKYLILLEPTDAFASDEGKMRMKKLGYVQQLEKVIQSMGLKLIDYRPFPVFSNPLNPTGLYIIEKNNEKDKKAIAFQCPVTKSELEKHPDHYYAKNGLLSYPIINKIPCLLSQYAILTSKHDEA